MYENKMEAALITLFLDYWWVWVLFCVISYFMILLLIKLTEVLEKLWKRYKDRKKSRFHIIVAENIFKNGVVIKVVYKIPKSLPTEELSEFVSPDLIAEEHRR